ncbi:MAG: hypothetical protein ACM30E_03635 [Nitrososphaerales archaeon]
MKVSKLSLVVAVVAIMAALALLGTASAQKPVTDKSPSGPANWPALDKVDAFKEILKEGGFSLTPGQLSYWDLVQATCEGKLPQAGNNPWPNVYLSLQLPPHEGVTPPLPIDRYWQLGEDEAIVLVGQTPPGVEFFHYQTFAILVAGIPHRMMMPVGDAINMRTINTIGPDPNNRPIVYIITGNGETERRVRTAALKAGYPASIINVEAISPIIAPLGVGPTGSWFALIHRLAVTLDPAAVENYARNPPYEVFRIKPDQPIGNNDPEPVPVLRVQGTGHTEMPLYPSLKLLRQAILDKYAGMPVNELDTNILHAEILPDNHEAIGDKPYAGLQREVDTYGASRDTVALATYPDFRLREGEDEFVIVYGANHQTTGKATYTSFTPYVDKDRWFGLMDGTVTSNNYDAGGQPGDSARRFLCPNNPSKCPADVQYLYAWKIARHCNGEAFCLELNAKFVDMDGQSCECNLYDLQEWFRHPPVAPVIGQFDLDATDINVTFRAYVEPATNVGPDDNELLYDRVIYFGPYFTEQ